MADHRLKNVNWDVADHSGTMAASWVHVQIAVLMDIRDELQAINRKLDCHNVSGGFVGMQSAASSLRKIDRRLAKKNPIKVRNHMDHKTLKAIRKSIDKWRENSRSECVEDF